MYVCICRSVTEGKINQAVSNGARTLRDLNQQLGVASQCGKCGQCARQALNHALNTCAQPRR